MNDALIFQHALLIDGTGAPPQDDISSKGVAMHRRHLFCGMVGLAWLVLAGTVWAAAVTDISVEQARHLVASRGKEPDFGILDVRTPAECAAGHLPNAVNVDALSKDFESRLRAFDHGKTYLVYCRSGNRSQKAVELKERLGFRPIYHLKSGMIGWEGR